jgi:hypothetical protein
MQLSADLPYGTKAIEAHLSTTAPLMKGNVSQEAGQAFMLELKRTVPERYANLERSSTSEARVPEALRPLLPYVGQPSPTLVRDILTIKENRTVPILATLLQLAATNVSDVEKRARKALAVIARSRREILPKDTVELASISGSSDREREQDAELILIGEQAAQPQKRRVARHYKNCKQCGSRFLPRRANHDFHSTKCRVRWNRYGVSPEMLRESANALPEAA